MGTEWPTAPREEDFAGAGGQAADRAWSCVVFSLLRVLCANLHTDTGLPRVLHYNNQNTQRNILHPRDANKKLRPPPPLPLKGRIADNAVVVPTQATGIEIEKAAQFSGTVGPPAIVFNHFVPPQTAHFTAVVVKDDTKIQLSARTASTLFVSLRSLA